MAEKLAAFKISGFGVALDDPIAAALDLINFHYAGWEEFKAAEARFPSIFSPIVSYEFKDEQNENGEVFFSNKNKQDEAESNLFHAISEAFDKSELKPILIHSLKGKIHSPETSEGFLVFQKLINESRKICDVSYFNTKAKKTKSPDDLKILQHVEIGDLLLFGNAGMIIFEVKGNDIKARNGLEKDVTKAKNQLQLDENWLRNCWKVVEFYLQKKNSNYQPCEMPPIHKFVVLPNFSRDMAVQDLQWVDSDVKLLCREDVKCSNSDFDVTGNTNLRS